MSKSDLLALYLCQLVLEASCLGQPSKLCVVESSVSLYQVNMARLCFCFLCLLVVVCFCLLFVSTLSNVLAELSLHTTWHVTQHVAHDKRSMCCA